MNIDDVLAKVCAAAGLILSGLVSGKLVPAGWAAVAASITAVGVLFHTTPAAVGAVKMLLRLSRMKPPAPPSAPPADPPTAA